MALAVMIVSNEGGKDSVTTIAASREEAKEAAGVLARSPTRKTYGIETVTALKYICRAWQVMGEKWGCNERGKGTDKENIAAVQPPGGESEKPAN